MTKTSAQIIKPPEKTPSLRVYRDLGGTIKAETLWEFSKLSSSSALVSGTLRMSIIEIQEAMTITGMKWWQTTQGVYTASDYNGVALATYAAGVLTIVASSTNDGNIWKATATTLPSKAFSSTYAATPGIYYALTLYNTSAQTTAPALGANQAGSASIMGLDFTNSAKLNATLAAQLTLPATVTLSATTTNSALIVLGLY